MSKKVYITGLGIITAIGNNIDENLENLKKGKSGIGKAQFLDSRYTDELPFGEIPYSNDALKALANLSQDPSLTRTDTLAHIAFQQAIADAQLEHETVANASTAFISASTVGGMSMTDQLYSDGNLKGPASPFLDAYNCGAHTHRMMEHYGMKGIATTFNTACSSSANSIMLGVKLIRSGRAKRAIVGGTDALAKFTVNGFNSLRILSKEPCKSFDQNRSGLTLGEGAAYLILESEEVAETKSSYGEVLGYGNANDAYHPSSISDEATGIILAISSAIKSAKIAPGAIDYVNTHGTGTENNDSSELTGLQKIFGTIPPYQSTKPYTGHTLAAAGAIEAIFSLLSIQNSTVFPSLNITNPISGFSHPIKDLATKEINIALSNSFGFGGNCSSIILAKR